MSSSVFQRALRVDDRISNGEEIKGVFVPENGVIHATSSLQAHVGQVKSGDLLESVMDGYVESTYITL